VDADSKRVYVTLGITAPVSVLDAASGKTILTCSGTQRTGEILHYEGTLLLAADSQPDSETGNRTDFSRGGQHAWNRVLAVDPTTGQRLWQRAQIVLTNTTLDRPVCIFPHQRCYPARATSRYLLNSQQGIEYVDVQAGLSWPASYLPLSHVSIAGTSGTTRS
jgi:hypothetical protein